jgi:hypothetical protein
VTCAGPRLTGLSRHLIIPTVRVQLSVLTSHNERKSPYFGQERHEHSKASEPLPRKPSIRDPLLNPTMFNARNVLVNGGSFVNTVVNEHNGMTGTGALYESVVNRYFLTSIYAKVSRYCIDGSRTALPMTPPNMHPYVTQIPARLLLVKS